MLVDCHSSCYCHTQDRAAYTRLPLKYEVVYLLTGVLLQVSQSLDGPSLAMSMHTCAQVCIENYTRAKLQAAYARMRGTLTNQFVHRK